ncbi:hypothetical protein PIECOFPK_01013 [Mycovorax composti]|uniref:Uncharacterized protein n=1 Tax=Mycovorax composti TaxID=2962693 RepID=A0ABZ2EIK7_9BACT
MKRVFLAVALLTAAGAIYAQTPEDALRYSWLQNTGTARSQGIANANGAIGGEISTIFSNPANIGFYKTSDLVITGGLNLMNNKTSYLGVTTKDNKSSGFLGTSGFVMGNPTYGNGSLRSSAFGFAINRAADFNNRITYTNKGGTLSRTSMADYFMEYIDKYGDRNPYSKLALKTYWVDNTTSGGALFSSASELARASGLEQKQEIITNGGITEFAFAGAANINDKVYLGATIGLPVLQYGATRLYDEQDPSESTINQFNNAYFDDDLVTKGVGINFKLGAVFKVNDNVRLGVYAHTPTWYSLSDTYYAAAGADVEDYPTLDTNNVHEVATIDPLVFDYNLRTPFKVGASFSVLFGNVHEIKSQRGFISGDIEYINYAASRFTSRPNSLIIENRNIPKELNHAIDEAYKGTVNARLGAELKFTPVMIRLGGAYYGNPYKYIAGEKGSITQITGGLGYRNHGFFVDLGYVHTLGKDVVFPYRLTSASNYPAEVKSNNSRVVLTVGIKI